MSQPRPSFRACLAVVFAVGVLRAGHQGGPHNHTIAALAVALKQVCPREAIAASSGSLRVLVRVSHEQAQAPEYKTYQTQVLKNCKRLADTLMSKGYTVSRTSTDDERWNSC